MKTYGTITLLESKAVVRTDLSRGPTVKWWSVSGHPHMLMMLKRVFPGKSNEFRSLRIDATSANAETLEWFMQRFPLEMEPAAREMLTSIAADARGRRDECETFLLNAAALPPIETVHPLRDYQTVAVRVLEKRTALLCGDDLGLGKTAIGVGAIATGFSPAIVVCQTHLQKQWQREIAKFLPMVATHIVKKGKPYALPGHAVLIIPYSKLGGWADAVTHGYRLVIFDECQELRRHESKPGQKTVKYAAAKAIAATCECRLGLSATPIYNYGDEIFNILEVLDPGILGSRGEFQKEWCRFNGRHWLVKDPAALGGFLKEEHVFLRRRRHEVGRELPAVTRIAQEVDHDKAELLMTDHTLQLARTVLAGATWREKGEAALELNAMMRLQTGVAKTPFVAEFVRQLVESGEKVVLCGWHKEVYAVWEEAFRRAGIGFVKYTGAESPTQKEKTVREFVDGAAQVFILSLRSGAGLNELQTVSNLIVFGELDWSAQVHEQCIGRLNRDDLVGPVTAVFLYAAGGADPIIMQVCGIKTAQSEGIINPDAPTTAVFDHQAGDIPHAATLARSIIGSFEGIRKEAA